ncbi:MAG TPA: SDR family NAD(P)-dependent oxidoreductase [Roseomonas sp.]|jgi:nucleoside-diphosphate-sugar epimerase
MHQILVIGLGYAGQAVACRAATQGWAVTGTKRDPGPLPPTPGVRVIAFADAGDAIARASHLLVTAQPGEGGDPVLAAHGPAIAAALAAGSLAWIGYVSSTGVYGDRDGAWVDEATPPAPGQPRTRRRLEAEAVWRAMADRRAALDILRAGGIYGPRNSVFDELRAGTARHVVKPGHLFSRIHRDDIALACCAAMAQPRPAAPRVLHLVDDVPVESAVVVKAAAALLGIAPPPPVPYEQALPRMSDMARSFWSENRRVANAATKAALRIQWQYPSWREGLAAILAEETRDTAL